MSSNKAKRLSIFRFCAPLASRLLGCEDELYFCPICGNGYPEMAASIGDQLTLEDVPPRSIGGKGLLLTCRKCNSGGGHKIDYNISNRLSLQKFIQIFTGKENGYDPSVSLKFNDERFPISVEKSDKGRSLRLKKYDPEKLDRLRNYWEDLSATNTWDGKGFEIQKTVKFDPILWKIALLRAGFLLLTAMLGYSYAFNERLKKVREQIINPENDVLGTSFWIERGVNQIFPTQRIIQVSAPWPYFVVTYDEGFVILPRRSSPVELYEIIKKNQEQKKTVSVKCQQYKWPEKAVMILDKQATS